MVELPLGGRADKLRGLLYRFFGADQHEEVAILRAGIPGGQSSLAVAGTTAEGDAQGVLLPKLPDGVAHQVGVLDAEGLAGELFAHGVILLQLPELLWVVDLIQALQDDQAEHHAEYPQGVGQGIAHDGLLPYPIAAVQGYVLLNGVEQAGQGGGVGAGSGVEASGGCGVEAEPLSESVGQARRQQDGTQGEVDVPKAVAPKAGKEGRGRAQAYRIDEDGQPQKHNELGHVEPGVQRPEAESYEEHGGHPQLKAADADLAHSVADGHDGEEEQEGGGG